MKIRKNLFALILFTCISVNTHAISVFVNSCSNIQSQFLVHESNYIISEEIDLQGSDLVLPENSVLVFKRQGKLVNGTLIGSHTRIKAKRHVIFDNVNLAGTWNNVSVFSEWLPFKQGASNDNNYNFINLMNLCNGDLMTHLYMQRGIFYCSVKKDSSFICVPSNTYWHNRATICQLPTDLPRYALVLIKKSTNVTIDGGSFIGDVRKHTGCDGEWGHGIKIAGSSNVKIINTNVNEFWGDGIDVIEAEYCNQTHVGLGMSSNIVIQNVKCLYNRRTGLSLEAVINAKIRKVECAFTGYLGMTAPGDGLGIEPWCNNELKIYNVIIEKCNIHNNMGSRDFACQPNMQYYDDRKHPENHPKCNIIIKKCKIGKLYILLTNQTRFINCEVNDIVRYVCSDDVIFKNCVIHHRSDNSTSKGLQIIN